MCGREPRKEPAGLASGCRKARSLLRKLLLARAQLGNTALEIGNPVVPGLGGRVAPVDSGGPAMLAVSFRIRLL